MIGHREYKRPKLSVCVVCYNHEDYIRQCLESIFSQETDFEFEVIIGDDNSPDGTLDVIRRSIKNAPVKVTLLERPKNVGALENLIQVHQMATGDYVAHIDGDDAMLPGKLQKQVDFLDAHPGCSVLWHGVVRFQDNTFSDAMKFRFLSDAIEKHDMRDLILYGPLGNHSSSMYRNGTRSFQYESTDVIDWRIYVENLSVGYGVLMHEVLGAYRTDVLNSLTYGKNALRVGRSMARSLYEVSKKYPEFRKEFFFAALYRAIIYRNKSIKLTVMYSMIALANISLVTPNYFFRVIKNYKRLLGVRFHTL